MDRPIKVIDLFSGPGGLGEGFSALTDKDGKSPFKISISIEKEESAYRTLKLRSFFRQFNNNVPKEYYDFLQGKLAKTPEESLYSLSKFAKEYKAADREAQRLELGKDNETINQKISEAIGSDECILIGGPPCQAYSLAGRARNLGNKNYKADKDQRNFLYKEYLKIIAKFQPIAFVMENVKGMLSAKVEGKSICDVIFSDLQSPCLASKTIPQRGLPERNYKIFSLVKPINEDENIIPKDFIIYSEKYGIPQKRHRVILLGIREDHVYKWENNLLPLCESDIPISDIISDLPKLRSGLSKEYNSDENWIKSVKQNSKTTIDALKNNAQINIANGVNLVIEKITLPNLGQGKNFGLVRKENLLKKDLSDWFYDAKLNNYVCNHETRGHLSSDLQRYLFCSVWAQVNEKENNDSFTPKSKDYPVELKPNHKNFNSGKFADRFRVQPYNRPATTITSHISKDGHYFIHPHPLQCRSLTVREAARIQTFPDNYFFVGNRTQQYVQVGNAVPPLLAYKIANTLLQLFT